MQYVCIETIVFVVNTFFVSFMVKLYLLFSGVTAAFAECSLPLRKLLKNSFELSVRNPSRATWSGNDL